MAVAVSPLVDAFGRRIRYVRMSVTDRCDFRCVYCMADTMTFVPRHEVLTLEELADVGRAFVSLGTESIRLTGGEPLLRSNVVGLVETLAHLPGMREVAMTTNGARLASVACDLREAGLSRLNISLDTLDAQQFREITRTGRLEDVLAGIEAAQNAGFTRIRLNSVILRGRNDDAILPLVDFARAQRLDLAFIEEMPLGDIDEHDRARCFMPSHDIRAVIAARHRLHPVADRTAGPARYFMMHDSDVRIGFISPHSHNFCGDCNRVRVTAEGRLLLCLGHEHSADLRAVLRHPAMGVSADPRVRLREAIEEAIARKPERHDFDLAAPVSVVRFMNATGG